MANIIEEIFKRLQRVNHIIASRTNVSDITFADACVIAQFYHDYQNTNTIIDDVEDLVRQDGRTLYECATDLKKEVDKFVSLDLSAAILIFSISCIRARSKFFCDFLSCIILN